MAFQVTNLQPLHKPLVLVAQPSSSSGWATAGDLLLGNTCPRLVVTPLQFIPVLKQDLSFFFPSCNVWTCSSDVILSSNLNTTRREKKKTQKVFEIYIVVFSVDELVREPARMMLLWWLRWTNRSKAYEDDDVCSFTCLLFWAWALQKKNTSRKCVHWLETSPLVKQKWFSSFRVVVRIATIILMLFFPWCSLYTRIISFYTMVTVLPA